MACNRRTHSSHTRGSWLACPDRCLEDVLPLATQIAPVGHPVRHLHEYSKGKKVSIVHFRNIWINAFVNLDDIDLS